MMKFYSLLVLGVLLVLTRPAAAQEDVIISEFMPANDRTLADEDGAFPDWIELFNAGSGPVNLLGWHLTDNPGAPGQWTFPSVTLAPGGFLVVFASGKNRTNDPAHLHTSFQLDADGGYLALVKPDGAAIASAFTYPAVKEDVSFGIAQSLLTSSLLANSVPRILVPTNAAALPANWNQPAYAPGSDWTIGAVPPAIGYDTNQATGAPANVAPSGTALQSTTLNASYPAANAINNNFGDFTHTSTADSSPFWQVTLTNEIAIYSVVLFNRTSCCGSRLRDITIQILSTNADGTVTNFTSSLLNPENAGYTYPNGPAYLSNNLVVLTGGPVSGRIVRVSRTPDPDLSGTQMQGNADEANVLSLGEVVVYGSGASGLRPYFTTDLQARMFNRASSAFVRLPFTVTNTPGSLTLQVRYDDGFVAYLNGVEIARRNAPATPAWDATATADRNLAGAITPETIDVSAAIPTLVPGTNVLAVQVLNASSGNADLLFQPELTASRSLTTSNVFFDDPTPGARNTTDWYYDEVGDTHFSVDRGFYDAPFPLSITSDTPDAVIYYSFNGDEPAPGKGSLYTGPITITNTTIVRARAFKTGWKATDVDTETYVFLNDVIYQAPNWPQTRVPPPYFPASWGGNTVDYGMDPQVVSNYTLAQWREALTQIPSMSIVTEMPNLFDATIGIYANASGHGQLWERPASLELLDPTTAVPGRFQENCGLRIRGGFSRNPDFRKHSFRIFFRREYGAGKLNYPLFENEGAQEFETFDLRTSQNYAWPRESSPAQGNHDTMVREVFCRETLGAMGQPYRRSRYYHLYLNGQYWGLYETDERPEASYGQTYFGGSKTNYDVPKCANHIGNFVTEATDGNLVAWSNLWSMCQSMRTNASNSNYFRILGLNPDGTRNPNLPVMIDVDNLIDYMLEIFYSGDGDATLSSFLGNNQPNNWFAMRDRTNPNVGFRFFNSDCEHTLGSPNSQVDRTGPFGGSNEGNFTYSNPQWMHEELMRNAEYRVRFGDHVQKHFFNGGALTFAAATNRFMAKAVQITKAIRAYSARWGDAVKEPPYGESEWTNEVTFILTNWFPPRAGIVLGQLRADLLFPSNGAPAFSQTGGEVAAGYNLEMAQTNANGVIFFTTDGADPRSVGGAVSPSAQAYAGPLVINSTVTIRARVLIGTNWSALLESVFYPPQDLSKLLITEIMYNPPAFGLLSGDEVEFLELKNTGTSPINLSGLSFTAGITFGFPNGTRLAPGAFFVLARNEAAFTNKYPGVRVNGIYTGRLDNGGETLTLSHPLGAKVLSVTYDDLAPWPIAPDNFGFSLVPVQPNANPDPDNPVNWRTSTLVGGSPGADDPVNPIAPVLINEVLSHSETGSDFIELFNPNTNAVDLGGWFLTDDPDTPKKYRIRQGTSIAPLGYLVFTETDFNATPGTNFSFSLNARGDDVYLFSGDANTNLTGYTHGFSFGAAPDGATFGRYVISTGQEQFPEQLSGTPDQPNAGPRVGPVVLSEIMYHAPFPLAEFVELRNLTGNPVPLFDPLHPTNTWRINGLGYTFPANLTLPPFGLVLLAATNEQAFRLRYDVPAGAMFLGQYFGQLQDSGERLELQRPDVPDTNGLAYITVDEVRYNDKSPWPAAADGSGASLQRKNPAAYGNDPANWEAAIPTPGSDYVAGQSPVILVQPQSQVAVLGSNATISVTATGAPPLSYQWRFNGDPLAGQTSPDLTLTSVQLAQAGSYSVIVFNASGSTASSIASLTVLRLPLILLPPANQLVRPGSNAVFTVSATGNGFLRYQWRFNGTNLPGQTNVTLIITNAGAADAGVYTVLVRDGIGPTLSAPASLSLAIEPIIVQQPLSQDVVAGDTVVLSVSVTNGANLPITYIWRRNGTRIVTNALSSYTGFLTITNASPLQTNYQVIVVNVANPGGRISTSAILNFLLDSDGDGLPDAYEIAHGFLTNAPDAQIDSDGDGFNNGQEYIAGTDPRDPLSYLKIDSLAASNVAVLTFGAISNKTYTLLFTDALDRDQWSRLIDVDARATNRVERIVDPSYTTNRFYRVATPRQP